MAEKLLAIAPDKVDLMLRALLCQLADTLDRMRSCHLCGKLDEQVHLGSDALEHFAAGEEKLGEQKPLCPKRKFSVSTFVSVTRMAASAAACSVA
jgi:hypothetical protein